MRQPDHHSIKERWVQTKPAKKRKPTKKCKKEELDEKFAYEANDDDNEPKRKVSSIGSQSITSELTR